MPYLIETRHDPALAHIREKVRPDHLAYLDRSMTLLVAAGATLDDDGKTPTGSFYIVDVEDRAGADAFIAAEPYFRSGILTTVRITRWKKAIFDFQRVLAP